MGLGTRQKQIESSHYTTPSQEACRQLDMWCPPAGSLERSEILLHPAALARIRHSAEFGAHVVQHVCLPSALAKRKQSQKALKANIQDICTHWTAI